MIRKPISNALTRSYEDFVPSSSVLQDASHETLVINLPEFKKEQVRVQIDSFGNLKITGERPLLGSVHNKWSRFRKDYRIPSNCNPNEIRAKFENGVLNVIMPKPIPKQEAPAAPATTPSPTQPATESNLPSPPTIPNPITDPIHALFQQMKDKLPTSTPQAPSTSSKPTATTPTQPAQKPATESKLPSPALIPNPVSDPIHALLQQMKDKFQTPIPQAPATSSKPTETTPNQPSHGPTTESRVSPVPHPTPVVQLTQKESVPTPTKVPDQHSHQYPTTNDDKPAHIPHPPPSQVSSTPISEITHRKKPDDESSNIDNNNAAQRTQEFEKIAKEKEEKKRKYVDAAEEMKGKKSSSENLDHGDGSGHGCTLEGYIEGLAMELKKPTTQLVVNMVVASMVVVGLITWTLKSTKRT